MKMTQLQVEAPHGLEGHTQLRTLEEGVAIVDRSAGAEEASEFVKMKMM